MKPVFYGLLVLMLPLGVARAEASLKEDGSASAQSYAENVLNNPSLLPVDSWNQKFLGSQSQFSLFWSVNATAQTVDVTVAAAVIIRLLFLC